MRPEDQAVAAVDLASQPQAAFIKDGTVTEVVGSNAVVAVDGGGTARPTILGIVPTVGQRVTMLFDPASNGTCVILGSIGGTSVGDVIYPVGAIYLSYESDDPADTFGFGTWEQIAEGEALVGIGAAPFDTVGTVAEGAEAVTLDVTEMPVHFHDTFIADLNIADTGSGTNVKIPAAPGSGFTSEAGGSGGITQPHNNIQPSFVIYVWRRTA